MKKHLALATLALAFVAGGSWFFNRPAPETGLLPGAAAAQETSDTGDQTQIENSGDESAGEGDAPEIDTSSIREMSIGDEDAPVTVIEYASYTCPHCRDFNQDLYPSLKSDYIDTGDVRLIYREVYFDRFGLWASMIARCGNEEKFFGLTDMLYSQQQEWTAGGQPQAIADNLRQMARSAGIGEEQLDACLTDSEKAQTLVAWFEENAEEDEVTATPTFIINGEKLEGAWNSDLMPAIDAALEE